jgi:WD40 repeat protein
LACSRVGEVHLFDLPALVTAGKLTDRALGAKPDNSITLDDLEFSADGKRLLARRTTREGGQIIVWALDMPDQPVVVSSVPANKNEIVDDHMHARFAPDGRRVALPTKDNGGVRIVDIAVNPPKEVATIPLAQPDEVSWHPATPVLAIASQSADKQGRRVTLWDLDNQAELARTADTWRGRVVIAYGPKGKYLAVADEDGSARLLDGRSAVERLRLSEAADGRVSQIQWTAAGNLMTFGLYETVRVHRVVDDVPTNTVYGVGAFPGTAMSPDGRWLAIKVIPSPIARGPEREEGPRALAALVKDALAKSEERIALVDRRTGDLTHSWAAKDLDNAMVQFSPDSTRLAVRQANTVHVRDVASGRELKSYTLPIKVGIGINYNDLAWDDQGRLLALLKEPTDGGGMVVWDVVTGKTLVRRTISDAAISNFTSTQITPNGRWLILDPNQETPQPGAAIKPCQFVDVQSGQTVAEFSLADGTVAQVAMAVGASPDGRRLLSAILPIDVTGGEGVGNTAWILRSTKDGGIVAPIPTAGESADEMLSFSPDSRYVLVLGIEGYALLLDAETGSVLVRWRPQGDKRIRMLGFTADGQIVTATRGSNDLVFLDLAAARKRLAAMGLDW